MSVCVIAGTAGVGKTSLALRWAYQIRDRFPDGQLYVNLRGYDPGEPVTAQEALHRFLVALGVRADSVPPSLDAAAALYRSLLADRRVLVVLDNAVTVGQVRPLLPGSSGCLAVVTSRSRLTSLAVRDGAHHMTLGVLPEAEAVALLREVTAGYRPVDNPDKLAELAKLCARLPLALRVAAERAVSLPHLRLDDLIADLRDESALWDVLSTGDDEDADAVRTVFAWSFRALPGPAARLFRLLGLHPGPQFGLHAAAALTGLAVSPTRQQLDSLVGAHLVEQVAPDRYQFHDLLRAYATERTHLEDPPEERDAALRRVLNWYLHTADVAGRWIKPNEPHLDLGPPADNVHPLTFADYNTAADWCERDHGNMLQAIRTAADTGHDRLAWRLSAALWNAYSPSAPIAEWLAAGRIGLEAAGRSGDRVAQARLLTNLGMGYTRVNLLADSFEHHRSALETWRDLGDRDGEAHSLNLIGLVHLRHRRFPDAIGHFANAVALFQEQGAVKWEATALANLATAHYRAGRLQEAESPTRHALTAHRTLNDQRGEGNALRLLSDLQCEQGDVEQGLRSAQDALDIALRLRNHTLEGYWLITLGNAQLANGEFAEAQASYHRSAALHRRLGDRSREALAWQGMGETYIRLGRSAEAAGFFRQAAAAHRELGDAWHEAAALEGLGEALRTDDPVAACRYRAEALELIADFDDPRARAARDRLGHRPA
ncbi:ATP-binding protein [Rhizohabitans arisaemae]|uniref:ATP-binding protein n=1 Tax=Rhizohabitans arisaemae TaxID=2720610 RepID=UPI0024B24935|nr:tetratricopeptide repeat protein [Rhizohabitans arisaemae]